MSASDTPDGGGDDGDRDGDPSVGADDGSTPALAVEDVRKSFGGLVAVDGATFDVPAGSITGLVGPNGAGKTTLFDCITGRLSLDGGSVRLDGREIHDRPTPERIAAGLGRTFQVPRVFGGMTVADNLRFAATDQTGESVRGALFRGGTVAREEAALGDRVAETLAFLDIDHLADEYAGGLSGGQRKLLELGRVLMLEPSVLLLDEPAAGVNPSLTDRILDRLHAINDRGTTILLIEHDMGLVTEHCDRVVVLHDGSTLAAGEPATIREDDRVLEVYLGGR